MSRLVVVRHGQASFFAADYDQLSSLGAEQSSRLGDHWAARGVRATRAFVGPRRRHRQTHDAVAAAYAARGLPWPDAEELPELDEHHGPRVVEQVLRLEAASAGVGPLAASDEPALGAPAADGPAAMERQRQYLRDFARVTRGWARGEIDAPEVESWRAFRARVERGIGRVASAVAAEPDALAVVFSSGGPVAATAALALGLGDEAALELSWAVSNASVSEFVHREGRLLLSVFNAAGHLEPGHVTMV